jgi:hypothetical protein
MRRDDKDAVVSVPGQPAPSTIRSPEWVCPDCDYFEEADEEGT